jgi:glyoxylase-like metal-dependent hydrolase (beta-lactamase superfamily II)
VATMLKTWPGAEVIATNNTRDHILGSSMKRYPKGAPDAATTKAFIGAIAPVLDSFRKSSVDPALPGAVRSGYASTLEELAAYEQDIDGVFLPSKISGFETERVLDDPVRPLELRFLGRGNTDGDLVGWLPKQRILATGDLVVAPIPFGFDCYPASWQSDLDKLIALHPRTIIPGHGLPMRDGSYLKSVRDMLADLRARMAAIGPKEDLGPATKDVAPAFKQYQERFAGNDEWLQSWFVKYWQTPVSEALWKESRGIPIEQGGG